MGRINLILAGNSTIEANGAGPLVLTKDIFIGNSCVDTLTLTGVSTADNEISGSIPDSLSGLNVIKNGSGKWILSGVSTYSGQLRVLDGTLVVGNSVEDFSGPFGGNPNTEPQVGSDEAGLTGRVALLSKGFTVDRSFSVPALGPGSTQEVVLGGLGSGTARFFSGQAIRLGRDVTLQASTGGVAVFASVWEGVSGPSGPPPAVAFTIGSLGNAGTVVFASSLPTSITGINVVSGTLRIQGNNRIRPATPVTLGSTLGYVVFDLSTTVQSFNNLIISNTATITGSGTLTITNFSGSGSLDVDGATLNIDGTNTMIGSLSIASGSVVVNQIVSGPVDKIASATFTNTTLTVQFSSDPTSGDQYQLLAGSTVQTYDSVLLTNTSFTGTYDSATSTLTIS
jgi:fibronectin-binding autotransporter adhesin